MNTISQAQGKAEQKDSSQHWVFISHQHNEFEDSNGKILCQESSRPTQTEKFTGDFIAQEWVRHWNGGWVNGNQWGVTLAFAPQPQYVPLNIPKRENTKYKIFLH